MKLISILLFSLILFGCKSTKNEPLAPVNIDYNQKFEELLGQFKADGNSVSYEEMWHVYLKSDQIQNSAVKQDDYLDILNQLDNYAKIEYTYGRTNGDFGGDDAGTDQGVSQ